MLEIFTQNKIPGGENPDKFSCTDEKGLPEEKTTMVFLCLVFHGISDTF